MQPASKMYPFVALFATIGLLAGCSAETAPAEKTERPVQVERVAFASESTTREFVGVVRARTESELGFRVAGKIVERPVNVGDRVRAGDVVARLDSGDLKLAVESAEAEFSAAKSSLAQAAADLDRYTRLKDRGFASAAEFDRKTAAKDEAEGRLDRASRNLDLARNQLAYADLKADVDGVITAAPAEPGQVVAIGDPVVSLARGGDKEAVVALPETWRDQAEAATATVRLWSDGGRSYRARLRELSPDADAATRTYTARFTIEDGDDSVALGMTAIVALTNAADGRIARLPLSAIFSRGGGSSVYRVDKAGILEVRPVTVASFTEDSALVTAGLADGDQVVTLGVHKLEAGEKVRTVETR
jgi:RND family efflux transporter MFP subunit